MADNMNAVRAIRLAELVQDYRRLQNLVSQVQAHPTPAEADGNGYVLLRQCIAEAQALLKQPFSTSPGTPDGDPEIEKAHLQYVTLDAAARRFRVHGLYLKCTAAMRWINSTSAVLQGRAPSDTRTAELQAANDTLQAELATITEERTYNDLQSEDYQQGKWLVEDPSLLAILEWSALN